MYDFEILYRRGEERMIKLTNDALFNRFFAYIKNLDLLIDFVANILDLYADDIVKMEVINSDTRELKKTDIDFVITIHLETKSFGKALVYMQMLGFEQKFDDILILNPRISARHGFGSGETNIACKVISIVITDTPIFADSNYHKIFKMRDSDGMVLTGSQEIHILDLTKISQVPLSRKEWWLRLFIPKDEEELLSIYEKIPMVGEASLRLWRLTKEKKMRGIARARAESKGMCVSEEGMDWDSEQDKTGGNGGQRVADAFNIAREMLRSGASIRKTRLETTLTNEIVYRIAREEGVDMGEDSSDESEE